MRVERVDAAAKIDDDVVATGDIEVMGTARDAGPGMFSGMPSLIWETTPSATASASWP